MHLKYGLDRISIAMLLALGAAMATLPAQAQTSADQRVRVRGTVSSIDATTLTVKTREGATTRVALKSGWQVAGVVKASVDDIKPGDFVGIASLPKADGGDGALEVLIFPAAMKGTGEGSYSWDLKPNSSMTNATVADAVKSVDGRTVTVKYQGKDKKISIADGTPIVTFAPATTTDLTPGAVVFVPGEKAADGAISTSRVVVGTKGVVPPM